MAESIKILMPIFNRATYARVRSFIDLCGSEKPDGLRDTVELTVALGSSLTQTEYGNAAEDIAAQHPGVKFYLFTDRPSELSRVLGTTSSVFSDISYLISNEKFHAGLVVADRFETLPAAMAFAYEGIPLIHLQGGEVTGNIDEKVRHAVTKLSDYHFVCTPQSKKYVIAMGEESNRVFFTGCPSLDIIKQWGIRRNTPKERYIMCFFHPDTENLPVQIEQTQAVLGAVIDYCMKYGAKCYWYWPNADRGREKVLEVIEGAHKKYSGFLVKAINLPPREFLKQLSGARVVLGNSSVGLRECSYLGIPAVNVGDRQSIRERSQNVVDIQHDYVNDAEILKALEAQTLAKRYKVSYLYGGGDACHNMLAHIKRFAWIKKGPLTYPYNWEYKSGHFDRERHHRHSYRFTGRRTKGKVAGGSRV